MVLKKEFIQLMFFSEAETLHVPTSVRELVLNGVRAAFALGRRKAHFEDRLVTLFFFLHHSFQIAARTWRELFPQALQPKVSTQEAWVNSRSSGYESDGKDSSPLC